MEVSQHNSSVKIKCVIIFFYAEVYILHHKEKKKKKDLTDNIRLILNLPEKNMKKLKRISYTNN